MRRSTGLRPCQINGVRHPELPEELLSDSSRIAGPGAARQAEAMKFLGDCLSKMAIFKDEEM